MTRGTIQLGTVLVHVMFSGPHDDGKYIGTATIEPSPRTCRHEGCTHVVTKAIVTVERVRAPTMREAWSALATEIGKTIEGAL